MTKWCISCAPCGIILLVLPIYLTWLDFLQTEFSGIQRLIDGLIALNRAQERVPQDLQYGGISHFSATTGSYFESNLATVSGLFPTDVRWAEAKAGPLMFSIRPSLFSGWDIGAYSGVIRGHSQMEGAGTFEVSVSNALGWTSIRLILEVAEDALAAAQKTPRLTQRLEQMTRLHPEEAGRERDREMRSRLGRFSGPFPAGYQVGMRSSAGTAADSVPHAQHPSFPMPVPAMNRQQLQIIYKDYRLYYFCWKVGFVRTGCLCTPSPKGITSPLLTLSRETSGAGFSITLRDKLKEVPGGATVCIDGHNDVNGRSVMTVSMCKHNVPHFLSS